LLGGDGPKLNDLLQMRERCVLQDRIELLGPVAHSDVREVLTRGAIFLNTSLTESFGIALLEAACAGLYVVATRVGGVPEILPEDMISFARPEEDDVFRALSDAIRLVERGEHDPARAHERVRRMYDWGRVAERTEHVYSAVLVSEERGLWERMQRTMDIGPFAGPIYTIILIVDCLFFLFLEWLYPREDIDYVEREWDHERFRKLAREHELNLSKREQRGDRTGEAGRCPLRVEVGEDENSLRDAANSNEPEGVAPALEDRSDGLDVDRLRVPNTH